MGPIVDRLLGLEHIVLFSLLRLDQQLAAQVVFDDVRTVVVYPNALSVLYY